MKYISALFITLMILSSCFGGSGESAGSTGLIKQDTEDFSISLPSTWQQIPESELVVPKSGEIALAYKSQTPRDGYINNIVILKKEDTNISAQGIMQSGVTSLEKGIKGYNLLENKTLTFADGVEGSIITYSGKYSDNTPQTVFVQTARVCGTIGYYMTISLTQKLENYERYEFILQNFACK